MCGGKAYLLVCLDVVLWHSHALKVHSSEGGLCKGKVLVSCFSIERCDLQVVLRYAEPLPVHLCEVALGRSLTLFGRHLKQFLRFRVVLRHPEPLK